MLFSLLTILLLSLLLFRLDVTHPMTRLGSAVPCWSPARVPIPLCSKCLLVSLWISGSLKSGTICILLTVASLLYAQYMVWSKALVEWHDHKFVIIEKVQVFLATLLLQSTRGWQYIHDKMTVDACLYSACFTHARSIIQMNTFNVRDKALKNFFSDEMHMMGSFQKQHQISDA